MRTEPHLSGIQQSTLNTTMLSHQPLLKQLSGVVNWPIYVRSSNGYAQYVHTYLRYWHYAANPLNTAINYKTQQQIHVWEGSGLPFNVIPKTCYPNKASDNGKFPTMSDYHVKIFSSMCFAYNEHIWQSYITRRLFIKLLYN